MKFNKQKNSGFVGILVLIIIVAVLSGGGVYVYQKNKLKTQVDGNYDYPATTTKTETNTNTEPLANVPVVTEPVQTQTSVTSLVYKNTEFGFSSVLSSKIGTPTIRTVAGFKSIIFPLKAGIDNKNGAYVTGFEVYAIADSSTLCSGKAMLPDTKNKYHLSVENSWFGDAGLREYFYLITAENKQFCVKSASKIDTESSPKLVDQVAEKREELQDIVEEFVKNFNVI